MKSKIALAVLAVTMAATACSDGPNEPSESGTADGHLAWAGEMNEVTVTILMQPGEQFLLGDMTVCTEGPEGVDIIGVEPLDPDVSITGFALRPNPWRSGGSGIGTTRGTLEQAGLKRSDRVALDEPCDGKGSFYELIVEMQAADVDTHTSGYRVLTGSGEDDRLDIPYDTHLCVDLSLPECDKNYADS